MKKHFITIMALALATMGAYARQLSENEARSIASQQFTAIGKSVSARQLKSVGDTSATAAPLYVFNNAADQGFVIVAGDDEMPSLVLGYSDSGTFDLENCAPALQGWYQAQAEMVKAIQSGVLKAPARTNAIDFSTPVEALVKSKWNQGNPYNRLTPTIDGKHCPTGCVATALSQIMYYWKYPQKGLVKHSYTWNNQTLEVDFTQSNYKWDAMTPTYDASSSEEACNAVAELMWNCGVALDMNYTANSSGAKDPGIWQAVNTIFGFDKGVRHRRADYMPREMWTQLIKTEIDEHRPVLYGGYTPNPLNRSGHQFICDGYDTEGLFHINWGWGGQADGYFQLDVLEPSHQGTGGSIDGSGFSYNQDAYFGLQPPVEGSVAHGWFFGFNGIEIKTTSDDLTTFQIQINSIGNYGLANFEGKLWYTITNEDTGEIQKELMGEFLGNEAIKPDDKYNYTIYLNAANMSNGRYRLGVEVQDAAGLTETIYSNTQSKDPVFIIENGKLQMLTLDISDFSATPIGVFFTTEDNMQYVDLKFNVTNTSKLPFKSALGANVIYQSSWILDQITISCTSDSVVTINPGETVAYKLLGKSPVNYIPTYSICETPPFGMTAYNPVITNGKFNGTTGIYREFEYRGIPKASDKDGIVTVEANVVCVRGKELVDPSADIPCTATIYCNIYKASDGSLVTTAPYTATYDGGLRVEKTLTFTGIEALPVGEYYAVLSYDEPGSIDAEVEFIEIGIETGATKIPFTITTSGVEGVAAYDTEAIYYNINGVKVDNPEEVPGMYIVRRGNVVSKVAVK